MNDYLIAFTTDAAYKRAIKAFQGVPHPRYVFPHRRMVVTGDHLEALKIAEVPFDLISRPVNGTQTKQTSASIQSRHSQTVRHV